ncbi:MAG: thiol peroxidase [Fusobacteriaceae bacterium]
MKRTGIITFKGNPLTLLGEEIKIGDVAPDFVSTKNNLSSLKLSDLKGKVIIISSMPSVDTGVCELQTIKFNQEAKKYSDIHILTISMDLPFALERFCANKDITNATTLSDYKNREFAHKYGFFIEELALNARGVVVIDKNGIIRHVEYTKEVTTEPNYEEALALAIKLI